MDDLVKRLRESWGLVLSHPHFSGYCQLMEEAAIEIERLRGLLVDAADDIESWVTAEYPVSSRECPSMERKYQRDMEIVYEIRALLPKDE